MIGLRVELAGESDNLFFVDAHLAGLENLADGKILQIVLGHLAIAPDRNRPHAVKTWPTRLAGLSNHTPEATAAALIKPKAASATARATKTVGEIASQAQRDVAAAGGDGQGAPYWRETATAIGPRLARRNKAPCRARTGRRPDRPRADNAIRHRSLPDRCRTATARRAADGGAGSR